MIPHRPAPFRPAAAAARALRLNRPTHRSAHTHAHTNHAGPGVGAGARRALRGASDMSRHSARVGGTLSSRSTSSASQAWASDSDSTDSASEDFFFFSNPAKRSQSASRATRRSRIVPATSSRHTPPFVPQPTQLVKSRTRVLAAPQVPNVLAVRLQATRSYSTDRSTRPSVVSTHLRQHWPAYAALVGSVTLGAYYFSPSFPRLLSTSAPAQFAVRRSSDEGGYKIVTALAPSQVDLVLRTNECSTLVDRPPDACRVARFDTNSVASNEPCEDKRAEVIVERGGNSKGDLAFFAVMDGHAGSATSSLLARKLIPFVAVELDKMFRQQGEYAAGTGQQSSASWSSALSLGGLLGKSAQLPRTPSSHLTDPESILVEKALRRAFATLDQEICSTPVELLKEYESLLATQPSSASSTLVNQKPPTPNLADRQAAAYEALRPAMNGSCALLTYIDSARGEVYAACTGDSRVLGGFWDPHSGTWTFEPLSTDQTGRNPAEVARMRAEHPPNEADQVILRGRVLGGLEPTRAFGDAVYKWDRNLQERLYDAFVPGGVAGARRIPRLLRTPPYVTSEPLVQVRSLPPLNPATDQQQPGKELRFIVMATDGLWDMLPNDHVGSLVAGHLAGLRGDVRADLLLAHVLHNSSLAPSPAPARSFSDETDEQRHPLSPPPKGQEAFTFEDDNLSTHLIRNALGGAQRDRVAGLLAIPSPESRRYRDDITVNVILLHHAPPTSSSAGPTSSPPSSKLGSGLHGLP